MCSLDVKLCSAVQIFIEIVKSYKNRNIRVALVNLRSENKQMFLLSGLVDIVTLVIDAKLKSQVGSHHIFSSIRAAKEFLEGETQTSSTYQMAVTDMGADHQV